MNGLVLQSGLAGFVVGSTLTAALIVLGRRRAWAWRDREAQDLTDADRAVLTNEFAAHADAVHQQVSQYADLLADGDVVLRERLRRFEGSR